MALQTIETLDNSPFKHLCLTLGAVPTVFTDAMSYYECMAWLIKYMREQVIPAVNNNAEAVSELQGLYTQLKNFVDTYFDNLDVQDEVNNKLNAMVEDGTFDRIINQEVLNWKMNANRALLDDIKIEYSDKGNIQAFCHTVDGKFITLEIGENNEVTLKEYNASGTNIRQAPIECYHPNQVCYVDGNLYIANAYKMVDGVRQYANCITKVNYSTLEYEDIELSHNAPTIAYDKDDNRFFILDFSNVLHVYNSDFTTLVTTSEIANYGDIYQSIVVNDGQIIGVCSYSFIVTMDKYTYELQSILNVRNFDYILAGELQSIDFYNGKYYINQVKSLGGTRIYWYIGSTSLTTGSVNNEIYGHTINYYQNKTVYINSAVTSVLQNGSQEYPFKDIEQGLQVIFNPYVNGITLSVYEGEYDKVRIENISKPIEIVGRGSSTNTLLAGVYLNKAKSVKIKNLKINDNYATDLAYALYMTDSAVELDNVKFGVDTSIYASGCSIKTFAGVTFTENNSMNIVYSDLVLYSELPNYVKTTRTISNVSTTLVDSEHDIADTINLAPQNLNSFRLLQVTFKFIATSSNFEVTQYIPVQAQNKINIPVLSSADSLYDWCIITFNMNLTSNRITGSYASHRKFDGSNIAVSAQPAVKIEKVVGIL